MRLAPLSGPLQRVCGCLDLRRKLRHLYPAQLRSSDSVEGYTDSILDLSPDGDSEAHDSEPRLLQLQSVTSITSPKRQGWLLSNAPGVRSKFSRRAAGR
jgi:hypothetical protein